MNPTQQKLILITAPPASGKTHWIESYLTSVQPKTMLVISPLRALANECKAKWKDKIQVMTPEEWSAKKIICEVVIFDEYHLHYYWGDTFRPQMWEVFYELCTQAQTVFLLTATLPKSMQEHIELMGTQFDEIIWTDHGNQRLKNKPLRYLKAASRSWLLDLASLKKSKSSTDLIFCEYRAEVFALEKKFKDLGFRVWTCVGGEAHLLSEQVRTEAPPDFIISTTVLSHGVNLPQLSRIFILYPIGNLDFWIQMVARGGRRGEKYSVYSLENPHGIKWNSAINALAILMISFKMKTIISLRQIQTWFLKE